MIFKPRIQFAAAILLFTLFLVFVVNVGFWRHALAALGGAPGGFGVLVAIAAALVAFTTFVLFTIAQPYVLRSVMLAAIAVAVPLGYVANEYGLGVDHNLLATALETTRAESLDLVTVKFVLWCTVLGALPAYVVWRNDFAFPPWRQRLRANALAMALSLAALLGAVFANYGGLTSLFRENKQLLAMVAPANGISATVSLVARSRAFASAPRLTEHMPPSHRGVGRPANGKPAVFVMVVGETARGDHFSINGYGRATSPRLAAIPGLVSYANATSCATLTADSLPCMFSDVGRAGQRRNIALTREGLLDVLMKAGFDVVWVENQTGCKGVCARARLITTTDDKDPRYCASGECHDEILVDRLDGLIAHVQRDTVVVLHQMGSHGPAYAKRYPAAFERFTLACRSAEFSRCTRDEIVAAYDNTIAYTDHVLGEVHARLVRAEAAGHPTALLYLSDHGESLGEKNFYLHGVPFLFAPRAQTHIPMVLWLGAGFEQRFAVRSACLARQRQRPVSHDNVFHTVLGLLDVRAAVHRADLDLVEGCRD